MRSTNEAPLSRNVDGHARPELPDQHRSGAPVRVLGHHTSVCQPSTPPNPERVD